MTYIYINETIKQVGMGNEDSGGKYPSICIKFIDGSELSIAVSEDGFNKIKDLISNVTVLSNRWYSKNDKKYSIDGKR